MNCIQEHHGEGFSLYNGDACEVIQGIPDNSLDFLIFSPPFSSLYIYSDSLRDMGNCANDAEFFEHYSFLTKELLRATRPGRLCAVHCKDLVDYKGSSGRAGLRDFPGAIVRSMQGEEAADLYGALQHLEQRQIQATADGDFNRAEKLSVIRFQLEQELKDFPSPTGWKYHSRVTIWKDPVTEMQRTKAHGLLHKQLCSDSSFSRQGLPDYLLLFRKWATEEDEHLVRPVRGLDEGHRFNVSDQPYIGTEPPLAKDARDYSISVWQKYASPVWFDIDMMRVLNIQQARSNEDEKHLCPLQLDVIERAVQLWSNPGDVVFTPFGGIGSELVGAMRQGRKAVGIELKPEYWSVAVRNCEWEIAAKAQGSLFDEPEPLELEMAA